MLETTGSRGSGRSYRTPVNGFRTPHGQVIALTYGTDSDWPKNVLAAGGGTVLTRGTAVPLTRPQLTHTPRHPSTPAPVRVALRLIGVSATTSSSARAGKPSRPAPNY